jgi:hypothetical protein
MQPLQMHDDVSPNCTIDGTALIYFSFRISKEINLKNLYSPSTMLLYDGEFVLESVISKLIYQPQYNFHIRGYILECMYMTFVTEENNTLKVGLKPPFLNYVCTK